MSALHRSVLTALESRVSIQSYNVVYHLLDGVKDLLSSHLEPDVEFDIHGSAQVLQVSHCGKSHSHPSDNSDFGTR